MENSVNLRDFQGSEIQFNMSCLRGFQYNIKYSRLFLKCDFDQKFIFIQEEHVECYES